MIKYDYIIMIIYNMIKIQKLLSEDGVILTCEFCLAVFPFKELIFKADLSHLLN